MTNFQVSKTYPINLYYEPIEQNMMPMRGSHIVAQLRSSFKRTSLGEHKWLTASSCCTIRSNTVLCWGDTSLVCSQSMTEHEGTPRIRSFLPDMRFLLRATFTWELSNDSSVCGFFLPNFPSPLFIQMSNLHHTLKTLQDYFCSRPFTLHRCLLQ